MKFTICAIIKDEQLYIEEWLKHCFSIGFTDIHLYEDEGSLTHKDIVDKYSNAFLHSYLEVEVSDYSERDKKQIDLFNHFIKKYKSKYDWCAFIDPDEFIRFDKGYTLEKLCNDFQSYNGIMMCQKTYGANGHITRPQGGLQENYSNNPFVYHQYKWSMKTIVNFHKPNICFKGVHKIKGAVFTNYVNRITDTICYDKCWYDHYYTKSWQDWMERFTKRGDVCTGNVKIGTFFIYNRNLEDKLKDELPLVFDIGCNNGDDSAKYLLYGCNVIGVECAPNLCQILQKRFIGTKLFTLEQVCITATENGLEDFYLSTENVWNSCNKEIAERIDQAKLITVRTNTLQQLIDKYGIPKYCKIDIEGNDIVALNSLSDLPQYISCESECVGLNQEVNHYEVLDKLYEMGYNKFFLENQYNNEIVTSNGNFKLNFSMPWNYTFPWDNYETIKKILKNEIANHQYKTNYDFWFDIYATK